MAVKDFQISVLLLLVIIFMTANAHRKDRNCPQSTDWSNPCQYINNGSDAGRNNRRPLKIAVRNALKASMRKPMCDFYAKIPDLPNLPKPGKSNKRVYYRKFVQLGKVLDKALCIKVRTDDATFSHPQRNSNLTQLRNLLKNVLCELYDDMKKNKSQTFLAKNLNAGAKRQYKILSTMNLTELKQNDCHIASTYENLLQSFQCFLHKSKAHCTGPQLKGLRGLKKRSRKPRRRQQRKNKL